MGDIWGTVLRLPPVNGAVSGGHHREDSRFGHMQGLSLGGHSWPRTDRTVVSGLDLVVMHGIYESRGPTGKGEIQWPTKQLASRAPVKRPESLAGSFSSEPVRVLRSCTFRRCSVRCVSVLAPSVYVKCSARVWTNRR